MSEVLDNPRAVIGDNQPPEPTPLEAFGAHVGDLMENARQFLDGEAITTQGQADDVGRLLDMCRQSAKDADKQRKAEKQPHMDAGKAVDAAWNPLIEKCELAAITAKKALAPFLAAEQVRKDAAAAEMRRIAEDAAEKARAAMREAAAADLAAREEAERLLKDAERADKAAGRAEKGKASAAGGARAVTLRDIYTPVLTDAAEALKHYRMVAGADLKAWMLEMARAEVRAGARAIPGFNIQHERVAH